MKAKKLKLLTQSGFTIVETMIALVVLATLILIVTVIMINIGNIYQKGINISNTQDNTRSIIDQVTQDLKYDTGSLSSGSYTSPLSNIVVNSYCIGSIRYSYVVGYRLGNNSTNGPEPNEGTQIFPLVTHVLWRDNMNDSINASLVLDPASSCPTVDVTNPNLSSASNADPSGTELIAPNSRLTEFSIAQNSSGDAQNINPFSVNVGVAYGPLYLLKNNTPSLIQNATSPTYCITQQGDQFCSTSYLSSTVETRVSN